MSEHEIRPREVVMSPAVNELFAALAKAQGELEPAKKDSVNPHFKSSYANLHSAWQACRAALSKNGLCVVQTTDESPMGISAICVVTTLGHSSGQWIRGTTYMPCSKPDAQGYGSALSYARRYALMAIAGVSSDDDDGNAAVDTKTVQASAKQAPGKLQVDPGFTAQLAACKTAIELMVVANALKQEHVDGTIGEDVYAARKLAWTQKMASLGGK